MRTSLALFALVGLLCLYSTKASEKADSAEDRNDDLETVCTKEVNCTCSHGEDPTVDCNYARFEDNAAIESANIIFPTKDYKPKRVHLQGCGIQSLKYVVVDAADTLTELDLSHNTIKKIYPHAFEHMEALNHLNLAHNRLTRLSSAMFHDDLGFQLHKLDLSYNRIKSVPVGFFKNLRNLKTLILDGNKELNFTKESFEGLPNLEKLSLDYCDIEHLPTDVFQELTALKYLSLRGNLFSNVPDAVNSIIYLQILDLSHTNIAEFKKGSLQSDHRIQQLFMTNMRYMYLIEDCAFCGLRNLTQIDFSNSPQLYKIESNAFGMGIYSRRTKDEQARNVTSINFSNCNISSLPISLIDYEGLDKFWLAGNPLICDCKSDFLASPRIAYQDAPTCAFPNRLKDVKVREATHICGLNLTSIFESFLLLYCICVLLIGGSLLWVKGRCNNIFYKPDMPHINYSNLTARAEDDQKQLQHDFDPPVCV